MPSHEDKWTAFLLSLAVPGVGQLWAGSATCLAWFLAAGGTVAIGAAVSAGETNGVLIVGQFASLMILAVFSAEHAKRLLEPRRDKVSGEAPSRPAGGTYQKSESIKAHVCQTRGRGRAINIETRLDVPLPASELWSRVADLPRFLTIDPFHERVVLMRNEPAAGVDLVLWHNAFGRRFARFGRILSWHAGESYAFSDLSAHGKQRGFPHVFTVQVRPHPSDDNSCTLSIAVRGKWTSPLVPAAIGRWWVWLVCREHARLLRKGL